MMVTLKKERYSNFEILRIFAMFLIIIHHLCQHGLWFDPKQSLHPNLFVGHCFYGWTGMLGNWLFVFTSGYFLSQSSFSWEKLFKIWFKVFFLSASIGIIIYLSKVSIIGFYNNDYSQLGFTLAAKPATIKDLVRSFLPTLFANNWFASSYILFYLFIPFLNESLKFLDQSKHKKLVLIMVFVGSVVSMIYQQNFFKEGYLFYFILGYYIANYIRMYNPKIFNNQKINLLVSLIFILGFVGWSVLIVFVKDKFNFIETHFKQVLMFPFAMDRFPIIICSMFVFSFFKNLKIQNSNFINIIASTTFGVYLIHENMLLNKLIWHRIFKFDNFIDSKFLFLYMIFSCLITFMFCSMIEYMNQFFIEKPIIKFLISKFHDK